MILSPPLFGENVSTLTDFTVVGSGGVLAGGTASITSNNIVMSGGVSVGGTAATEFHVALLHSMTGGVSVGGAADLSFTRANIYDIRLLESLPFGGMVMGGAADVRDNLVVVPTGGMLMGGSAVVMDRIPYIPTGGMLMGGTVTPTFIDNETPVGGMLMGGTATVTLVAKEAPSGGMVMSGSASVTFRESLFVPSGGMEMGGTALAYMVPSGFVTTPENPYGLAYPGWAINLETNAASRYMGLPANSMTQLEGRTFVANAAGIYEIGADSDAGKQIDASVHLGTTDFGEAREKRMEVAYLGVRTQGKMRVKVTSDQKPPQYYAILPTSSSPKGTRIPIGKGLKGRYWNMRLDNVEGSDFDFYSVDLLPYASTTRHGA